MNPLPSILAFILYHSIVYQLSHSVFLYGWTMLNPCFYPENPSVSITIRVTRRRGLLLRGLAQGLHQPRRATARQAAVVLAPAIGNRGALYGLYRSLICKYKYKFVYIYILYKLYIYMCVCVFLFIFAFTFICILLFIHVYMASGLDMVLQLVRVFTCF